MPYFICPNCRRRSLDEDGLEGLTGRPVSCTSCGFGFLFEIMDDYYPAPGTGLLVCDAKGRVIAVGQGVFELTGFRERDLIGRDVMEALFEPEENGPTPAALALEWGVRRFDQRLTLRTRSGRTKGVRADFFPAYDEDGGLLVAVAPR
ncbi:MAG TPA: PAS domain-containing protein [Gaiellaceae bacterium]|nr:PAS domain-containing protein [Gaiellaceae bacterium]